MFWTSVGHAFASSFSSVGKGMVATADFIQHNIQPREQQIEGLEMLIPIVGTQAEKMTQLGFAALGLITAGLHYGGEAFEKMLLDNGADAAAIQAFKDLIQKFPSIITSIEKVYGKPGSPTATAALKGFQSGAAGLAASQARPAFVTK